MGEVKDMTESETCLARGGEEEELLRGGAENLRSDTYKCLLSVFIIAVVCDTKPFTLSNETQSN